MTAPKKLAKPGAGTVEIQKPDYKITMDSDHYISNNLPMPNAA